MKRILGVVSLLLLAFTLVACGGDAKKEQKKEETKTVAKDEAKIDLTVGFIYVGPIGDGGWSYAQDQGRLFLEKETGVKTIYKEAVPEGPEVLDVIRDMVDQGAKVIIAGSFGYMDYVEQISAEFPEITFLHCSGYKTTKNMGNFFGRIYQARYLSGIVAGLKTKSNKIGYVAAFPIPEVIRGINAFTLGAKSVNPNVTVEVVWTNTWYDPAKEKDAAIALLDRNADVIAQHQDTGGPQLAAQERGVFSIGYNSDMSKVAPKANMTSAIWNWGPYFVDQIKAVNAGTWEAKAYWGGLKEGTVMLSPLTDVAPKDAQAKVDEVKAKILDGTFHIFEGEIKDQNGVVKVAAGQTMTDEEMLTMKWFVEGVVGTLK